MVIECLSKVIKNRFRSSSLLYIWNRCHFLDFSCKISGKKNMNSKPPNILIYTGTDSLDRFKEAEANFSKCLHRDSYLFFHLLPSELKSNLWMEHSMLLIVLNDIENSFLAAFETYFKKFGNILVICSRTNSNVLGLTCSQDSKEDKLIYFNFKNLGKVFLLRGKYSYISDGVVLCQDQNNKPLIQKITKHNILITSEIHLDRDPILSQKSNEYSSANRHTILKYILTEELGLKANTGDVFPELSPGYLFCKNHHKPTNVSDFLDNSLGEFIFNTCKFRILNEEICIPIYFSPNKYVQFSHFDEDLYFSRLCTVMYGHYLVYFPVITSTMDAAYQLSDNDGIVIVAGCQISGKGRQGNQWISPEGCAMFTLHFTLMLKSNLGKKLTLLQHIASLALIRGIKNQEGYKDLSMKIKWPNDIYYNKIKLGGILVSTVVQQGLAHVHIGWGINVANKCPTTCINSIIDEYNFENKSTLSHLRVEEVIAFTVTQMECYVKDISESGADSIFKDYYLNWMHSNQKVTVAEDNQHGTIIGLDEFGFLKILLNNGGTLVFQPDGNRFDIMNNLIYAM